MGASHPLPRFAIPACSLTAMVAIACLAALLASAATPVAAQDLDGDGWSVADGDLYDVPSGLVTSPELVNPGAFEIPGNGIDDDCNGIIDDPVADDCSTGSQFSGVDGIALVRAMDLCRNTVENPPLAQRGWGVVSAELRRSETDGAAPAQVQVAVNTQFGTGGILPQGNATMAVLSTGTARATGEPGYIPPAPGFEDATNSSLPPAAFVAAHGGRLIGGYSGCPVIPGNTPVFDGVLLRLRVRVPTNANAIGLNYAFLTSQFPDVCTAYNDHFLALLTTNAAGIPVDRNITFDALFRPITVGTTWYDICTPQQYQPCPLGSARLQGTGFDPAGDAATSWLAAQAPVVPGEVITLEFFLFDVGDHGWDSTVLLDNLQWSFIPQAVPTAVDDAVPGAPLAFALARAPESVTRRRLRVRFSLPAAGTGTAVAGRGWPADAHAKWALAATPWTWLRVVACHQDSTWCV